MLTATFVVQGAEAGLRDNPSASAPTCSCSPGTMTDRIGGVRLMSAAIDRWMPRANLARLAAVRGVAQVSPQWYLATLKGPEYSTRPEAYLVAYDPATDVVLRPWLVEALPEGVSPGQAVVGADVRVPAEGEPLTLFGSQLEVAGRLTATSTSIDQTIFVTFQAAEEMGARSEERGDGRLQAMPGSISAIMLKAALDADPHEVAIRILEEVPGVVPLETPDLFQAERRQMAGVLRTLLTMLGIIWGLTVVFVGMVFAIAANERRQEIGVLRALGFPRGLVLRALLYESAALALAGGLAGALLTVAGLGLWGEAVVRVARLPLHAPSPGGMALLSLLGQATALVSVVLAAFVPSWRISHEEVALTMRE